MYIQMQRIISTWLTLCHLLHCSDNDAAERPVTSAVTSGENAPLIQSAGYYFISMHTVWKSTDFGYMYSKS